MTATIWQSPEPFGQKLAPKDNNLLNLRSEFCAAAMQFFSASRPSAIGGKTAVRSPQEHSVIGTGGDVARVQRTIAVGDFPNSISDIS